MDARGIGLVVVAVLVGCGGETDSGKGGSGGSGAVTSGGGGASSGGGAPSGGGGGATGATTGTGGTGGTSCYSIAKDYAAFLAEAKLCNPVLSSPQCTKTIASSPECACPTHVNPANQDAIVKLEGLLDLYGKMKCNAGIICACALPQSGYCSPDSGRCADQF